MTPMKIVQYSKPQPPCSCTSKFHPPPCPWTSNFKRILPPPLPSPSDKQSVKRKHNPRMTFICYQVIMSFLQVGFRFQYQLISLVWLSFWLLFTVHLNEQNQNKNKTKLRHIQIDHAFQCSIDLLDNVMMLLKDVFTV